MTGRRLTMSVGAFTAAARCAVAAAAFLSAALVSGAAAAPLGAQQRDGRREADELERPEVEKLVFRGVKAVDEDELEESIQTSASHCKALIAQLFCPFTKSRFFYEREYLDREEFARDVLRMKVFYFKRGYRDAQVDTAVTRSGRNQVTVAFNVTEGPPTVIDTVIITQLQPVLQRRRASGRLRLRKGAPLDLLRLDTTVVRLRQALWNRGYADAVIDTSVTVDEVAHRARIEITIDPKWKARVGSIEITREGDRREVSDRTILNSLSFRPGDVYVQNDVLLSQRTLYESNLFSRATIVVPPQGDSVKTIAVTVREAPLRESRVSAGFNTVDYFQVDGRFIHYNFFGGARRLTLSGSLGNLLAPTLTRTALFRDAREDVGSFSDTSLFLKPTWQASVDVTQPWFRSSRNSIGANAFAHRRATTGVVIDRGFGGQLSFTRQLGQRAPATLAYRYEVTRVEAGDVYFCINFGVCDRQNVEALRRRQSLSPLALTSALDRTNNPLSPTTGMRARLDLEHASAYTGSAYRYNRAYAEASYYFGLGRGLFRTAAGRSGGAGGAGLGSVGARVLAVRGRGGWVGALSSTAEATNVVHGEPSDLTLSIVHPRKRFYAGGSQSVRGFGENQLGPRVLTIPADQLERLGCDLSTPAGLAACDPNATVVNAEGDRVHLGDSEFTPRPLGGNTLFEANVEYRFPLWKQLGGAVFVDGAIVGTGTLRDATRGTGAITPGLGARYYSPVGPIRVDVGFNPVLTQNLTVVTERRDASGQTRLVELTRARTYAPARTEGSALRRALNRMTLHFSIGQAF